MVLNNVPLDMIICIVYASSALSYIDIDQFNFVSYMHF